MPEMTRMLMAMFTLYTDDGTSNMIHWRFGVLPPWATVPRAGQRVLAMDVLEEERGMPLICTR